MIEPPEVFVLGPYIRNMLGKPGTVMPRCAWGAPAQLSCRSRPSRPRICIGNMKSWVLKPVAQIRQSSSRSWPSAVRMPPGSTALIASVTSSTLARCSAGRKWLEKRIRLQPKV